MPEVEPSAVGAAGSAVGEPLRLTLKASRAKVARNRHPWVFSRALQAVDRSLAPGALADLHGADGEFVARGYANPRSQIVFRALSRRREPIDRSFFRRRVEAALAMRGGWWATETDAYRLLNGEGDGLPGAIVDHYGDHLVCQLTTAGMDRLRELLLDALEAVVRPRGIWERSDGPGRREEGLDDRSGALRGAEPPERIEVRENGVRLSVDVRRGHKTGFYLDHRGTRAIVRQMAAGRTVLDAFAYTGGFTVAALIGGATEVVAVESSAASLALLDEHLRLNQLDGGRVRRKNGDAFRVLREESDRFGLVIVDPPPFAKRRSEVDGAARGYKDINLQAMKRLEPGGLLVTSCCSHHVGLQLFQQVLFAAAKDADAALEIVARLGHGADHPVSLMHPEGEYLKTLVLRRSG